MNEIAVFSTASSDAEAKKLARILVEKKIAACVQIIPNITSIYRWRREVNEDKEFLMIIKTLKKNFKKIKDVWKKEHSYQVPELIAFEIKDGIENYMEWLRDSCG